MLRRQFQTGAIARRQFLPIPLRHMPADNGADCMKHIAGWEIISLCQLCFPVWLRVSLFLHDLITLVTKLQTCGRMDRIVNAAMAWTKATEKCIIISIYNGIHSQPGNIALPKCQAGVSACNRKAVSINDSSFFSLSRQKHILYFQKLRF